MGMGGIIYFCAHHDIVSLHFRLFLNQFFTLELQAEKKNDTVTNFLYLIEKLKGKKAFGAVRGAQFSDKHRVWSLLLVNVCWSMFKCLSKAEKLGMQLIWRETELSDKNITVSKSFPRVITTLWVWDEILNWQNMCMFQLKNLFCS